MSKIKTALTMAGVLAAATLSLTVAVSAATALPDSIEASDPVHSLGYWYAEYPTADLSNYSNGFNQCPYATLDIAGKKGSFTGKLGRNNYYKSIQVVITNYNSSKMDYDSGTKTTVTGNPNISKPLKDGSYFCELLDGEEDTSDLLDGYYIKIYHTLG